MLNTHRSTEPAAVDHLVVAARTLAEGVDWCQAALGATPAAGGPHPLMGTHNRLLALEGGRHPHCYLEIIAIDPGARPARAPHQRRWYDLDDPVLQATLVKKGPRLIHWVARLPDVQAAAQMLAAEPMHIDRGPLIAAARGTLMWQITVRDDGQRLFYGALPSLIQWGGTHPADSLPPAGLALLVLEATHPRPAALRAALNALGLRELLPVAPGPPNLLARLRTPRGLVTLESQGL